MPLEKVLSVNDEAAQAARSGAANALREEYSRLTAGPVERPVAVAAFDASLSPVGGTPLVPFFPEQRLLAPLLADRKHSIFFGTGPEYVTFGGIIMRSFGAEFGGGLATAGAGIQAVIDGRRLLNSSSLLESTKYGAALIADGSMAAGGLATAFKLGPKWLAPSLLIGGFAGRIALDFVPDEWKKK